MNKIIYDIEDEVDKIFDIGDGFIKAKNYRNKELIRAFKRLINDNFDLIFRDIPLDSENVYSINEYKDEYNHKGAIFKTNNCYLSYIGFGGGMQIIDMLISLPNNEYSFESYEKYNLPIQKIFNCLKIKTNKNLLEKYNEVKSDEDQIKLSSHEDVLKGLKKHIEDKDKRFYWYRYQTPPWYKDYKMYKFNYTDKIVKYENVKEGIKRTFDYNELEESISKSFDCINDINENKLVLSKKIQ